MPSIVRRHGLEEPFDNAVGQGSRGGPTPSRITEVSDLRAKVFGDLEIHGSLKFRCEKTRV